MKSNGARIGVVVATRNRPQELHKLLTSLSESTVRPMEVSIVASGIDVREIVQEFSEEFGIKYHWTAIGGQVAQKKVAIALLDDNIDWCLFSDDDVIFDPSAIEAALNTVESSSGVRAIGVGFAITPLARITHFSSWKRMVGRLLWLDSKTPGRVLKSGHGVSYLESTRDLETEWLNGISMWRREVAQRYQELVPAMKPASCEDLLFSYKTLRFGKLKFASRAKVYFQESEMTNSEDLKVLNAAALWRLYLVKGSSNLSLFAFLISQCARVVFVLLRPRAVLSATKGRYLVWFFRFALFALRVGFIRNSDRSLRLIRERIVQI